MKCEEFVGPATGTGQRARCSRTATYLAALVNAPPRIERDRAAEGDSVLVCGHHASDFRRSPRWVVRSLAR